MRGVERLDQQVLLVAHEPPGSEHLGVRMLAAALAQAGFEPVLVPLCSPAALDATVADVVARRPLLVGISLSDPLVAPLLLAFVRLLRRQGFAGHVTAGGALATLQRREVLAEHPGIDSVVRHAGELSVVALACALAEGRALDDVPGLTTRTGDGAANPQAFLPPTTRPLRPAEMPTVIGIPTADLAASRGCAGQCAYCGVAALQRDLRAERHRLCLSGPDAPGSLRRSVDDIADEVADLYHRRGVRIGHFVDDNLFGPDAAAAADWLADFERALARRRVGTMAWRAMIEPRAISEAVADRLARLGFLSVLVGLESLTPGGLRALGRTAHPEGSLVGLDRLAKRGIAPVVNVLALRPGDCLADARAEIAALDRIDGYAWDVLALNVWPGTRLAEELAAAGQLVGRGAGLAWRPDDPAAERFLFALDRLRLAGLAWLLRKPNAVEAGFALRAAHRLGLAGASQAVVERADLGLRSFQQERRRLLLQALALAESPLNAAEFGQALEALAAELARRLGPCDQQLVALLDAIEWPADKGTPAGPTGTPSSRLATRWLAGTVFIAMTACSSSGLKLKPPSASDASVLQDSATPVADSVPDEPPIKHDSTILILPDAWTPRSYDVTDADCDTDSLGRQVAEATGSDRCDLASSRVPVTPSYVVVLDGDGRPIDLLTLPDRRPALTGSARQAWLDAVANMRWPCLAGQEAAFACTMLLY